VSPARVGGGRGRGSMHYRVVELGSDDTAKVMNSSSANLLTWPSECEAPVICEIVIFETHARTHARTHTHTHESTHARTHARTRALERVQLFCLLKFMVALCFCVCIRRD